MPRVLHYSLHGLAEHRLERVHEEFEALAAARAWRCGSPWVASSHSRGLFEMEYFRHMKKVEGERIFFYPPTFRLHSQGPPSPEWAYALCGIRAYAPTLLEAEQEALKILRGFGHLAG